MNLIRKITNSHSEQDEEFVIAIKNILGYRPRKVEFYKEAFTHSSLKEMNKNVPHRNTMCGAFACQRW